MMGQRQTMDPAATVAADKEAGGALMRRIMPVVAVAAVMVALMVASVKPAFAAPNTTYTCFSDVSGDLAAEGLSEGQAKQFENDNLDTFCVPTGQEQLAEEVLTGNRKIPPGQLKRAEERIAVLTGQRQVKGIPPGQQKRAKEQLAEGPQRQLTEEPQRQLAEEVI